MQSATVLIDHPLVQHKLTVLRKQETSTSKFRGVLREIALLLTYEVTRDLPLTTVRIQTPIKEMDAPKLDGKKLCFVSVLRAGNGLLEGMLDLVPSARVGHVGLYREPDTLEAKEYYFKVPSHLDQRRVIIVDPMLATGHSAVSAVTRIKQAGATDIRFLCLLAAPEGIRAFHQTHPDVTVYTAAVDQGLNEKAYIVPGLGDAGDRMFGTK